MVKIEEKIRVNKRFRAILIIVRFSICFTSLKAILWLIVYLYLPLLLQFTRHINCLNHRKIRLRRNVLRISSGKNIPQLSYFDTPVQSDKGERRKFLTIYYYHGTLKGPCVLKGKFPFGMHLSYLI